MILNWHSQPMGELHCSPEEKMTGRCRFASGASVLDYMGIDPNIFWEDVGLLVALVFAFRLFAFIFLFRRSRNKELIQ